MEKTHSMVHDWLIAIKTDFQNIVPLQESNVSQAPVVGKLYTSLYTEEEEAWTNAQSKVPLSLYVSSEL